MAAIFRNSRSSGLGRVRPHVVIDSKIQNAEAVMTSDRRSESWRSLVGRGGSDLHGEAAPPRSEDLLEMVWVESSLSVCCVLSECE